MLGETTRPLVIEVSGWPPGVNERLCWQARRRLEKPFKDAIGWQCRSLHHGPPLQRARVAVAFVSLSRRYVQGADNTFARAKPLVDGLKGLVIVDDAPAHLQLEVRQELGRERGVRLEITPLEQETA